MQEKAIFKNLLDESKGGAEIHSIVFISEAPVPFDCGIVILHNQGQLPKVLMVQVSPLLYR